MRPVSEAGRRSLRSEDGQALVEFAMVVPILLVLILGLVEFSRAWNAQQVLTDTAREALRNAVVANPEFTFEALLEVVDGNLQRAALDPEKAEVTVEGWKTGTGTPATIHIDYSYDLGLFASVIGWATGSRTLALSTSYVMRNE